MTRLRAGHRVPTLTAALLILSAVAPVSALPSDPNLRNDLKAYLDGKPIPLAEVGSWYCEDFAHPIIQCYSSSKALEMEVAPTISAMSSATSSVTYVVIYDFTTFQGGYMYLSDDYPALGVIGWND